MSFDFFFVPSFKKKKKTLLLSNAGFLSRFTDAGLAGKETFFRTFSSCANVRLVRVCEPYDVHHTKHSRARALHAVSYDEGWRG